MIHVLAAVVRSTKTVMEQTPNTQMKKDTANKKDLFISKVKEIYPNEDILSLGTRFETFRINTLANSSDEILKKLADLGFEIKPGPFTNSYINFSSPEKKVSQTSLVDEHILYIQGLSSMLDAVVLNPKPNEKILDLCAAPGSKTTQIGIMAEGKAEIFAVETNSNRFNFMKKTFANYGLENIQTIKANAAALVNIRPDLLEYFDKVLVDVPCSNEGNIRDIENFDFKFWNPKLPKKLSQLQKKLLATGIKMLKRGGELIYSTCTYSLEENEQVIEWALKHFPEVQLETINFPEKNFVTGFTHWKEKEFGETIIKALRVLPNQYYAGFFIARFVKN